MLPSLFAGDGSSRSENSTDEQAFQFSRALLSFPWHFPSAPLDCKCPLGEGFVLWQILNIVKGGVGCALKKV